jgi:mediator of RNA polymerase II transcription subunit 17
VAHLSHATLPIASIPQLSQLLAEEAERCLLERIRELGQERSENGTWFVDPLAGCAFGRWDGGVQSV